MGNMIINNVIKEKELRDIQLKVLEEASEIVSYSFGPMGSNTCIKLDKGVNIYTKDGHTILKSIHYNGPIEEATLEDLVDITQHIVNTIGDGTTSAVKLSDIIFKGLLNSNKLYEYSPYTVMKIFNDLIEKMVNIIDTHKRECTVEDIYNITLTSTNGNEEIAQNIKDIYTQFGNEVYIDLQVSLDESTYIKTFEGMSLEAGYADACFVTDVKRNTATVRNASVYVFEDPIDTVEMVNLFDAILIKNILSPYSENKAELVVPTVIICPKLSRDMSVYMEGLATSLMQYDNAREKPPLLVITNVYNKDQLLDIAKLCNVKTIKKYIDSELQKADIKAGKAPTPSNVEKFAGKCEEIVSDSSSSKFINPEGMFKKDGSYSDMFNSMIAYLESELKRVIKESKDLTERTELKKRINSLKSNLVEYYVGGIAITEREAKRALAEDAIKNCRSAALYGVGYAANFEGLRAIDELIKECGDTDYYVEFVDIIKDAYIELSKELYQSVMSETEAIDIVLQSIEKGKPLNILNNTFDGTILSSIEADKIVLQSVVKIITMMYTCNQFVVPTPAHNVYEFQD